MSNEASIPTEDNNNEVPAVFEDMSAPPVEVAQASDTSIQQDEAPAEAQPVTVVDAKELTALKNRLRAEAEREVLDNHRPEYHEIAARKFGEHGLEFARRMTAEEKAEEALQKLLAANPALAAKYAPVSAESVIEN